MIMENFQKKKSFSKELIKQFSVGLTALAIILYFATMGTIGYFVINYEDTGNRIFAGFLYGILLITVAFFFYLIVMLIADNIVLVVNKIKAVKRYTYLPLTVEEIRQGIKNALFLTEESYIRYICEQLRYHGLKYMLNLFGYKSIKLTNEDLILLCKSVEEIYGSPVVFTYEKFYEYLKKYNAAFLFEFKTEENNIDSESVWLDFRDSKHIAIFCTDMNLAEEVIKDTDLEYVIYNVAEEKIKISSD